MNQTSASNITWPFPCEIIQDGFRYHPIEWAPCTWNVFIVRWIIRKCLFPDKVWHWKGNYRGDSHQNKRNMLRRVACKRCPNSPALQQPKWSSGKWFPVLQWKEESQTPHRIGHNGRRIWHIVSYSPIPSFSHPFRHPWLLHLWFWCRTLLSDLLKMLQCLPHINCLRVLVTGTSHICLNIDVELIYG